MDTMEWKAIQSKHNKFYNILVEPNINLSALRKQAWNGIPDAFRPMAWQILTGYLPCNSDRRESTLCRKRKEYSDAVHSIYSLKIQSLDQEIILQIQKDLPRTHPTVPLFKQEATQQALERILYCWAIRHPASGYVQGINDLLTPFFLVFLSCYADPETCHVAELPVHVLNVIEADSYWCLSKLLDGIQDNYTHKQPGIQRQLNKLRELVNRIHAPLANHLKEQHVEVVQFAFRWINCLLMREISLNNTIRMWDTYLAEGSEGFSEFHIYVCGAFLVKWANVLMDMDFQDMMIFLQSVPTSNWTHKDMELLLSEAYMWKMLFHNAPSHLNTKQ